MSVLIVKNIESEGPGLLGELLIQGNIPYNVVEANGGGCDSPSVEQYESVVVLGGPMGVYEMDDYPGLKLAAGLIEKALKADKKVFGVCLGAQLMAHVLGARVYKGPVQEIGWMDIELTPEGKADRVIGSLSQGENPVRVFQWHGDTFDLPAGAVRLAGSAAYENQAFRYGGGAYALQFHVEAGPELISQWFAGEAVHGRMMEATAIHHPVLMPKAVEMFKEFLGK